MEREAGPGGVRNPSLITGRPLSHPGDPGVSGKRVEEEEEGGGGAAARL